jgi:hypothetical protein
VTIRFSVAKVWDLSSRKGLLAAGWVLGGTIEPGTVLADPDGATTTVLSVEFQSPADRESGQTTLLLERTTPSPVVAEVTLTAVSSPAELATYEYLLVFETEERTPPPQTVLISEVTLGPPRTVLYHRGLKQWQFNRSLGASLLYDDRNQGRTQRVSRAEAEETCRRMGTRLPTETDLRHLVLSGEANLRRS